MTAEIAILNKIGVALAADSTVSISTQSGDKTYNTTNKLFTLSKYHPVAIMVWNGMQLNGVPMELIIKGFRESLGSKSKPTLVGYSNAFIRHLKTRSHVGKADQASNFANVMLDFSRSIRNDFLSDCEERGEPVTQPKLTGECSKIFSERMDRLETDIARLGMNPNFKGVSPKALQKRYPGVAARIAKQIFAAAMPSPAQMRRFVRLLHEAALANFSSDDFTGFVVAGYGSKEYYPSVLSHQTDGIFANRLKIFEGRHSKISRRVRRLSPPSRAERPQIYSWRESIQITNRKSTKALLS